MRVQQLVRQLIRRQSTDSGIPWHRQMVGGYWDQIGRLQFDYLVQRGLRASDVLLDVGCGSLRAGRFFIEYLEPEHYLGLDAEADLIQAGLEHELPAAIGQAKKPRFVVSDRFAFDQFERQPTVGLAQSLFTHLTPELCRL